MSERTFAIVGAGLAGAKAAETLREEGFDGRIVLLGAEAERPYERPPLSKEYLRGETEDKPYVHDAGFYAEHDIDLRAGTAVEAIDHAAAQLTLAGGETLGYDRLLLTTGAEPRTLPLPGAGLDGVVQLRTVEDSAALRDRIAKAGRLVTIGAGWIGAEAAASARQRGCEVTLLEAAQLPLERVLGPELGAFYRDVHADHGSTFIGGAGVEAIEGDGTVAAVRLADGRRIEADTVLIGIGAAPRVALAEAAGIETGNGVLVDENFRTSAPGIYAAGDVANALRPFYGSRLRVEHWGNALTQGPAAARAMLDLPPGEDPIPYFFSDQYDVGMEYAGFATEWDEVCFRGDPAGREFIAFWLKDGRVEAGMNVNVWDVNEQIQALVRSRHQVDRGKLTDPEIPLDALLPGSAA